MTWTHPTLAGAARIPKRRRYGARPIVNCLLPALLLVGTAPAPAAESQTPGAKLFNEQEPITPVPVPPAADPRKLELGGLLFEDSRLSRDGRRACVSCHDTHTNGASFNRRDKALDGSELPLNTITVFNAALNFRLNWQGDFRSLEAQAEASLKSPELGASGAE